MLQDLKRFLLPLIAGDQEWLHRPDLEPSFRIADRDLCEQPMAHWIDDKIHTYGLSEWLYYGSPDEPASDFTVCIYQLGRGDQVGPLSIATEIFQANRLGYLGVQMGERFYALETPLGAFRAQEMTIEVDHFKKSGLGFVSRFRDAPIFMKGWQTAPAGHAMTPEALLRTLLTIEQTGPLRHPQAEEWLAVRLGRRDPACVRSLSPETMTQEAQSIL